MQDVNAKAFKKTVGCNDFNNYLWQIVMQLVDF